MAKETKTPKGYRILTAKHLAKKERQARKATDIPVQTKTIITRGVYLTPSWCRNGDLERCPAPCGACLENADAGSLQCKKIEKKTVLDVDAYNAHNLLLNLTVQKSSMAIVNGLIHQPNIHY